MSTFALLMVIVLIIIVKIYNKGRSDKEIEISSEKINF